MLKSLSTDLGAMPARYLDKGFRLWNKSIERFWANRTATTESINDSNPRAVWVTDDMISFNEFRDESNIRKSCERLHTLVGIQYVGGFGKWL